MLIKEMRPNIGFQNIG